MATTRRKDDQFAPVGELAIETLDHADDRIAETLKRASKPAAKSDEKGE